MLQLHPLRAARHIKVPLLPGLLALFFLAALSTGQAQLPIFDVAVGPMPGAVYNEEEGRGIQQLRDGGLICVSDSWGDIGAQITRFDANGAPLWQRYYWEDQGLEPFDIHQTGPADEGFVFVGANAFGDRRAVMLKIDDLGNLLWYKRIGTPGMSEARSVEVLANGNYVMCGFEQDPTDAAQHSILLVCYDPLGVQQWSKSIDLPSWINCPKSDVRAYSLRQIATGNLIITGSYRPVCTLGADQEVFLMNFNTSSLNVNWTNKYATVGYDAAGMDVRETCEGDFLVAGTAKSGYERAMALRTSQSGTILWSNIFGVGLENTSLVAIEETSAGGAMLVGNINTGAIGNQRILSAQLDSDGALEWSGEFHVPAAAPGNMQIAGDMEINSNGTYAIAASTTGIGTHPAEPETYVINMLCKNTSPCNFTAHLNNSEIEELSPRQALGFVTEDRLETLILYYNVADYPHTLINGCTPLHLDNLDFMYHFNTFFDRGYAGVSHVADYGTGAEPAYTTTGWTSNWVSSGNSVDHERQIPIITHDVNGNILSDSKLYFDYPPGEQGSEANDIKLTSSGGFIIGGRLNQISGIIPVIYNAVMVKTDKFGVPSFTVSIGKHLPGHDESFHEVTPVPTAVSTDAGGYLAVGYASRNANIEEGLATLVDQSGVVQWIKSYQIEGRDELYLNSICPIDKDSDGIADDGFIIAGYTFDDYGQFNGITKEDIFVMEIDINGTIIWAKSYAAEHCKAMSIIQTDDDGDGLADDGYVLCGVQNHSNRNNALVMKLNSSGVVSWSEIFDRSVNDQAMSIIQGKDGNFVFTGVTGYVEPVTNNNFSDQVYIVRITSNGEIESSYAAPDAQLDIGQEDCGMDIELLDDGTQRVVGSSCTYGTYKGDFLSIKLGCGDMCGLQHLNDESEVTHTMQTFTHVHDNCGVAGNTLCSHVLPILDWQQDDEATLEAISVTPHVLCENTEPCIPSSVVSHVSEEQLTKLPILDVHPNPIADGQSVTVNLPNSDDKTTTSELQLVNTLGHTVLKLPIANSQAQLNISLSDLAPGAYMLILSEGGVQTAVSKLIKQ